MKKTIRIEKPTVLAIVALMLAAIIIPAALANVTNLSFVSATPSHVQPGDTVTLTYKFMVDKPTQDVRVQVLSGITVISEVLIGYTGGSGSAPTDTWIEKTIAVAIPLSAPVGPYDVVIQARQPDGGAYDVVLSVAGLVTVDPPPIVDTSPPVITPSIGGTLGDNGWYVSDVTVSWTITDPESAITSTTGAGTTTINYDTSGVTLTCTATSLGGTNSVSVTIKRDATLPTIAGSRLPAANSWGWNNEDVVVHFDALDATSGLASVTADTTLSGEGAGQSVTGTAVDNAGNSASDTVSGINIDKTKPTVTITSPADGATYVLNQPLSASWSATDALSGIDTATGTCANGAAIQTGSVGTFTFEVVAVDKAGNTELATVTYYVKYSTTFGHRILQPLEQVSTPSELTKTYKAGSTLPVKFQLCDYYGNPVGPANPLPTIAVEKLSSTTESYDVVEVLDSGASNDNDIFFRFDSVAQQYIFNLSTKGQTQGTYRISVSLDDGSSIVTYFQLKK